MGALNRKQAMADYGVLWALLSLHFLFAVCPALASDYSGSAFQDEPQDAPASQPAAKPDLKPESQKQIVPDDSGAFTSAAEESKKIAPAESTGDSKAKKNTKRVFRGSSMTIENAFSAISLMPNAELTYNPLYYMNFSFDPMVWIGDIFYLYGHVEVTRELTQNDWTTYADESVLSDMLFDLGAKDFYELPFIGIAFSSSVRGRLPTSKSSWGQTMLGAASITGGASRTFAPFSPELFSLSLGYKLSGTQFFHRYTTGENQDSLEDDRCLTLENCAIYASNGVRNVQRSVQNRLTASFMVLDWVGFSLDGRLISQWLYPAKTDPRVSYHPEDPTGTYGVQNMRYLTVFGTGLSITPDPAVTFTVGTSAIHPQLKPDGTYRIPGFNRYTNIYADVTCNWDGLASFLLD